MSLHEEPVGTGRKRGPGQRQREFALSPALAAGRPGSCTLCVASKTVGHPFAFMIEKERMSTTRLLYPNVVPARSAISRERRPA